MATLAEIRSGIQTRLETINGLYAHDVWPNSIPQFPAAVVMPETKSSKQAMGGYRVITFTITLLGGASRDLKRAQSVLDPFCDDTGDKSIIAALEGDLTLGGKVTTVDASWRNYGDELEIGKNAFITVTFDVTVWP